VNTNHESVAYRSFSCWVFQPRGVRKVTTGINLSLKWTCYLCMFILFIEPIVPGVVCQQSLVAYYSAAWIIVKKVLNFFLRQHTWMRGTLVKTFGTKLLESNTFPMIVHLACTGNNPNGRVNPQSSWVKDRPKFIRFLSTDRFNARLGMGSLLASNYKI